MTISWLHVSDFHFKSGDAYDRDVVLRALVRSVEEFRNRGRKADLVFATGDIAYSGKDAEYVAATAFFDALLAAAGVEKRHLYLVPGNHDVNRDMGAGLSRTLSSREEADQYFRPAVPKNHITQKQAAFRSWYNDYFAGIRALPEASSCGPVEAADVKGSRIGILPLNSALFCQGDDDHAKLWVGRRCLDEALRELRAWGGELNIALLHHPLAWLHDAEASNVRAALQDGVDVILRGHLHETDVESVVGVAGQALHIAAGAAYQGGRWPKRAHYATAENGSVSVFPIRYEDQPREVWTVEPSVSPPRERIHEIIPDPAPCRGHIRAVPSGARTRAPRVCRRGALSQQHSLAPQPSLRRPRRAAEGHPRRPRRRRRGGDRGPSRPARRREERTGAGVRASQQRRVSERDILHRRRRAGAADRSGGSGRPSSAWTCRLACPWTTRPCAPSRRWAPRLRC
jgi:predicted phosphodiesterase